MLDYKQKRREALLDLREAWLDFREALFNIKKFWFEVRQTWHKWQKRNLIKRIEKLLFKK